MGTEFRRSIRFDEFLDQLTCVLGHADRHEPLRQYCAGLLLPGKRKSVEPMAARLDPRHVSARHQSLLHFVGKSAWSDEAVLRVAREWALPVMEAHGPLEEWIIDDTGLPKKGRHSVGVANQYCGVLGKNANCQVTVTVSVANESTSLPVAHRLYLPEKWADDPERRRRAGVPGEVRFRTKWQIALDLIDGLLAAEPTVPRGPVNADAGYGDVFAFRAGLSERGLTYIVGVRDGTTVWRPGEGPSPPVKRSKHGPTPKSLRRAPDHLPVSVRELALGLSKTAWKRVAWREGSGGTHRGRFAAVRVRPAHRDYWLREPHAEEWLLIEWPEHEPEPTKYWLSTLSADTPLRELVRKAKLRWRIERDYQDLKQEVGLGHYEGRGWRGFHHHITLAIAAYAFLLAERARLSPPRPRTAPAVQAPAVPDDYRPRGAAAARRPPSADVDTHRHAAARR